MIKEINEAVAFIQSKYSTAPVVGIVLGSGLGSFADEIDVECEIEYSNIPLESSDGDSWTGNQHSSRSQFQ